MSLLDKFDFARQLRQSLAGAGTDPTTVVFDRLNSATEGVVEGRTTILAGTNNYLGLTFNPDCIDASEFSPFKPLKDCFEPISNLFGRLSRKKNSEPEIPLDGQDIENGQYKKLEESGVQSRI